MMYMNSRTWILLFLFYGAVSFLMGLFGYWLKTDKHKLSTVIRVPIDREHCGEQRNLMVESEKYLTKFFARFNSAISNVPQTESTILYNSGKTNETIPVLANSNSSKLVFCYPEVHHSGVFQSLITRYRFDLKTSFAGVKEIPIMAADDWEDKLGKIIKREQPPVLIGINLTRQGLAHPGPAQSGPNGSTCEKDITGVDLHIYFTMAAQWQRFLLPQMITNFSGNLNSFTLRKQRVGGRDVFEIVWPEVSVDNITGLERNLEPVLKILEQVQELRTAKKI